METINEKSVQFEVTPKFDLNLNVTVEDIFVGQKETIYISTINLFNGNITVSINGENKTVNVINGTGNYTISNLEEGNYTVNVTFNGNDAFNAASKLVTFEVSPKYNLDLNIDVGDTWEGDEEKSLLILYLIMRSIFQFL